MNRLTVRLVLSATGLMVITTVTGIGPALAHSKLVSSSPTDGAVLDGPPAMVEFTFDGNLLEGTNTISINDVEGNVVATQPVEPDGHEIRAPWPTSAGPGQYQVAYRIVSTDGHPVTGAITFTVPGDPSSEQTSSASASAAPQDSLGSAAAPNAGTDPGSPLALGALVLALALMGGLAVLLYVRTTRRRGGQG